MKRFTAAEGDPVRVDGWTHRSLILLTGAALVASGLVGSGAPATGATGSAPKAPDRLTVGDRARPLNVQGAPMFGWLPQDRDAGEVQTAYRLRVEGPDGEVWDSGKVTSSAQSYLPYAGEALAPGTTYRWQVRTWDRTDQVSPWSAATFDTGLSDGDWSGAAWIRRPTTEPDDYTMVRKQVDVAASPVVRARVYTSAFHQYRLHLNGVEVDDGPAFGYSHSGGQARGEGYYQATDVTDAVAAGEPLAIAAIYHWYGSGQGRPSTSASSPLNERGFLLKLVIDHADGSRQTVVTDGSWRVRRASQWETGAPRRNSDAGDYTERIDARSEPLGWDTVGYDASAAPWQDATVVGPHPTAAVDHLTGQEPRLAETVVRPVSVQTLSDGAAVADFGVVIPARPTIHFSQGSAGRQVDIQTSYALTPDGHASTGRTDTQGSNMTMRYTQRGGDETMTAFLHWGWRYLEIKAPGAGEPLTADDIGAVVEHTDAPSDGAAEFSSSDQTLDAVWDLLRRSALYGVQHQFVDTPTREKGQFLGDAADISFATMSAWFERDATQKALREFANSQLRYWTSGDDAGRLNAVYPNGDGKRDIPDYTEMYPGWVWRYFLESGDTPLLDELFPTMRNVGDYIDRHRDPANGLITRLSGGSGGYLGGIIDWPAPMRYGYDWDTAVKTVVNLWAVDAYRSNQRSAAALGRPAEAALWQGRADDLVAAINLHLRRPDGVYVDGIHADGTTSTVASQHSSSFALAFGVVPAADVAQVGDYVASLGMKQGPMTAHRLLQGLDAAGRDDAVLDRLTDAQSDGWANLLARGGTFTWEQWNPESNESYSHGWGAQSAVDVVETMLGVRVTAPGASRVDVLVPRTALRSASGSVRTQRGVVAVDWERGPDGVHAQVRVPVNVTAVVSLPVEDGFRYLAAGGAGNARYLGTEDGRARFEMGSGTVTFQAVSSDSSG
jgi:alpha-L-rhamnosidase